MEIRSGPRVLVQEYGQSSDHRQGLGSFHATREQSDREFDRSWRLALAAGCAPAVLLMTGVLHRAAAGCAVPRRFKARPADERWSKKGERQKGGKEASRETEANAGQRSDLGGSEIQHHK
ncbi:MAG: hypothetical protein DMG26_21630 [Acidobacteria bacterium]|nr:MAG: hypothetical protein DMG26_21630 [Acidobacteriota bacterium]